MGVQQPPGLQGPGQSAAINAAVKANARQAADLWRFRERQQYYTARGGFHVPKELSRSLLGLILRKVAGVSDNVVRQFQPWGRWEVQTFYPPAPPGVTPRVLQAEIHFSRFIAAFMAVVE